MIRRPTRWSIPALRGLPVLALAACHGASPAPAPPASASAAPAPCTAEQQRVADRRRALEAGRLLQALGTGEPAAPEASACQDQARALAIVALEASAALGDAEAVQRRRTEISPPATAPALFAPDGPVERASSPEDAAGKYDRAVTAYLAGEWAPAGQLGLAVGAGGGPLAVEGFILAARSAEHAGDAARAARMWARAHRAGCVGAAPCALHPPREDLFARAALHGRYEPWSAEDRCAYGEGEEAWITHGSWQITTVPGAIHVREIPSRVLLERIATPPDTRFVCFSRDGRVRAAHAGNPSRLLLAAKGEAWKEVPLPAKVSPGTFLHVADDGRVVIPEISGPSERVTATALDPFSLGETPKPPPQASKGTFTALPGDVEQASVLGSIAPDGTYYAAFRAKGSSKGGIARAPRGAARWSVVLPPAEGAVEVGPADTEGRLVARVNGRLVRLEGATGRVLADIADPLGAGPTRGRVGLVPPSTVVWSVQGAGGLHAVDLGTGARTDRGVVWYGPEERWKVDVADLTRAVGALPSGPSGRTLGDFPGFTVVPLEAAPAIELRAMGRAPLRLILTADRKGAMVIGDRDRFELLGQIPLAFRAAASCGPAPRHHPPTAAERALPLEICGAALEHPGLAEAWLGATPPGAARPQEATPQPRSN